LGGIVIINREEIGGWVGEDRWAGTGWGIYEDRCRQGWMNGYAGGEVFGG